jgi:putative ABC transport system permease protein
VPGKKEEMKTWLSDTWKKLDKIHPVHYVFMEEMQERFESQVGGTIRISAWGLGFVILIALFGLLGMATYTTELKVKEIGIRKVLGASVSGMAYLLSKNYIKLIFVSAVFALPAGYFLSASIMQFFAFRPGLSFWVLPGALAFVLALALITIGSQTVKAALANPVKTLREE